LFPLGDSDTLPPPLSTTAPEIASVAKLGLPNAEIRSLLAMRPESASVPLMATIEPDAIVAPLSRPLMTSIYRPPGFAACRPRSRHR
jgi:hypothetical protein